MKSTKTFIRLLFIFAFLSCNNEVLEEQNNQEFIEYNIDDEESSVIILEDINATFNPEGVNPWTNSTSAILDIFSLPTSFNQCFRIYGFLNDTDYLDAYNNFNYPENDTGFMLDDFNWWSTCPDMFNIYSNNSNITYNLTSLGEVDEFIDINFNGSYNDYDGNIHTISGIVHVLRDE